MKLWITNSESGAKSKREKTDWYKAYSIDKRLKNKV